MTATMAPPPGTPPGWQSEVLSEAVGDGPYAYLVVGSCLVASFGLLANSAAVIIGAMILAPLMLPIRALALAWLLGDRPRMEQAIVALGMGLALAILVSGLVGWLVGLPQLSTEALARTSPNLLDLGVALVAGAISAQAKVHQRLADSLAGTAIAVALMPPLCTVGLALALQEGPAAKGAFLLFLTNLLGILLACILTFALAGGVPLFGKRKGALLWTGTGLVVLCLPLGWSFRDMLVQSRLEVAIREGLAGSTTFRGDLELIKMEVVWSAAPPLIWLTTRGLTPPSPHQVQLLESHLTQVMKRPCHLRLTFTHMELIEAEPNRETLGLNGLRF